MLFYIVFIASWLIWILFADKKRFRKLLPVGIFSGYLGALTNPISNYFHPWDYHGANRVVTDLIDDAGIYIVVSYLFIQWLPKIRTLWKLFSYWFIWTSICFGIEWIFLLTGNMEYHHSWNCWWSYAFDWILFTLFFWYYKIFYAKLPESSVRM